MRTLPGSHLTRKKKRKLLALTLAAMGMLQRLRRKFRTFSERLNGRLKDLLLNGRPLDSAGVERYEYARENPAD